MSEERLPQDATASTRGTIYHLCVAVKKCYELREGQKLLIEELGDLTIEGEQQIEVKQHSGVLTDGHYNFWNTLSNWMRNEFDSVQYRSLILHTTQEFGPGSRISQWNELDAEARLALLNKIHQEFESGYRTKREKNPDMKPSKVLLLQRKVLAPDEISKLQDLIRKVYIEARAQRLSDIYEELKQDRVRGVLKDKKDEYLNSLIGFVCRTNKKAGEHWSISYGQFDATICDLNSTYHKETKRFPRKHFPPLSTTAEIGERDDLFVRKIRDIDYSEVIHFAIRDYEATLQTLKDEFETYTVASEDVSGYLADLVYRFNTSHRMACRKCKDEVHDSQDLYDETTRTEAPLLRGFGDTPVGFRNGLLHQRMNDQNAGLRWRLTKP